MAGPDVLTASELKEWLLLTALGGAGSLIASMAGLLWVFFRKIVSDAGRRHRLLIRQHNQLARAVITMARGHSKNHPGSPDVPLIELIAEEEEEQ